MTTCTSFPEPLPERHEQACAGESARAGIAAGEWAQRRLPLALQRTIAVRGISTEGSAAAMPATSPSAYDELPYSDQPHAQSHPDRLATIAKLFGLAAPSIGTCRVLELGCASGGNLIPMALGLPNARFLGIDSSARQLAHGRRTVETLGLSNIELREADIADVDAGSGRFDYVIAHGAFSWVPAPIREKTLAIAHGNLSPNGVAYVSFNALPGWRTRGMIRDMMLHHAAGIEGATARVQQARAFIEFLAQSVTDEVDAGYGQSLRKEFEHIRRMADAALCHDHLSEHNDPVYFHAFAAALQRHGPQYVGEAEFASMLQADVPPEVAQRRHRIAPDILRMEQYTDFLRNRMFRQSLLTHQGRAIQRQVDWPALAGLRVTSAAAPLSPVLSLAHGAAELFQTPNGSTFSATNAITKAAMSVLQAQFPLSLPFDELAAHAEAQLQADGVAVPDCATAEQGRQLLGRDLLQCYGAAIVELRTWSPQMTRVPSDRPRASALARLQAQGDGPVTNLRHELVPLEGLAREVLRLADGTRGREALTARIAADAFRVRQGWTHPGPPVGGLSSDSDIGKAVDDCLLRLGRHALLID